MKKESVTFNAKETQELGEMLALELKGGEIVCLTGDLGAGKIMAEKIRQAIIMDHKI